MSQVTRARRRAAAGIAAILGGTVGLAIIGAGTANAHEGTEPVPVEGNLDCADLAELLELTDVEWEQDKIEPFPDENGEYDYTLSDRGTPDDESDDAVFTLEVFDTKRFNWSSNVGIDAIVSKGGDGAGGSYYYYFDGEELTEDVDYTVPPYGEWDKNAISHVTICWDDEYTPPTTSSTTSSSLPPTTDTTAPPTTDTTAPPTSETTATTAPSSTVTTAAPTTTTTPGEELPRTGSNSTMTLVALGAALLAVGAGLVFGTRRFWHRNAV